ncbi:riboflavin synthase subunit alpha [Achlya hypogyna]|uniref:Riboflavin synthase n=1 Tax=Achlya hypogyna TaxID=1202772 RepID=A0A1V9ZDZ0_ACHHY|nr:riboflavin synthase subunit alpha [Achlya hypogyna]
MFTGIIEEIGTCVRLEEKAEMVMWDGTVSHGVELVVAAKVAFEGAYIGCSIAINGTCLTVTEMDEAAGHLSFGVAPESYAGLQMDTLRKTNLKNLKAGDKVNVERAMGAHDRNSGHFVQGHVDGTGDILDMTPEGESLWVKIKVTNTVDRALLQSIIPKGFIAIDGTSLTVCEVDAAAGWFNVMLITHTQASITLPTKKVGDPVNIEGDMMGKYAAKASVALEARLEVLEKAQTKALLAAGIVGGAIGACVALVATQR